MTPWRMKSPCDNCPFSDSEAGKFLRSTLNKDFVKATEANLRRGGHFICHKTINETGWVDDAEAGERSYEPRGGEMICAGAIDWQARRRPRVIADLVQIMERLEMIMGIREGREKCGNRNESASAK